MQKEKENSFIHLVLSPVEKIGYVKAFIQFRLMTFTGPVMRGGTARRLNRKQEEVERLILEYD